MRYRIPGALIVITVAILLGSGPAFAASNACKADLNGDLVVNFGDLAVLKSVFFQSCSPTCGDGVAQSPWEQCDDGNVRDGDGCSRKCEIEGPLPLVCGDGMAVTPERCDDGNLVDGDGCSSDCTIERPLEAVCGNGVAQGPTEQCDDGNDVSGDGCSKYCTIEVPPEVVCGDGIAQGPAEQCDDGNGLNGDGCSNTCTIEVPPPAVCGDGVAQGPKEQCDDGNRLVGDGCNIDCRIERPMVAVCGDGFADRPEQCDDGNFVSGDGCSCSCQIEHPVTMSGLEDRGLTVFDHATNLEWEKKTTDGSIHDKGNVYMWSAGWLDPNPSGTAFTVFLASLNAGACSACQCDWRLPTAAELWTIQDCSNGAPCVAPIFGPTQSDFYWSSTTLESIPPIIAWSVSFSGAHSDPFGKTYSYYVRAVRSGP